MAAQVRCLLPEQPVVEMIATGLLSKQEGERAMGAGIALSIEHDVWNTLADFTHMRQTAAAGEIVELADALARLGVADRWREAVVLPEDPNSAVWVRLWEAAAVNRGMLVRSFHTRAQALEWLLSDDPQVSPVHPHA